MDPFTHTFVGLAAAKAGLERMSPLATTVCVLAANSPDSDIIVAFTTDRWNYLHHHRGITHSIIGVIALAVIVPSLLWAAEFAYSRWRQTKPRARYRWLLLVSAIVTATHPLMDWTNNYGIRPFLPWSSRWYYGDLVFIVDPFILLLAGGAAFLGTEGTRRKMVRWAAVATAFIVLSFVFGWRRGPDLAGANVARIILLGGTIALIVVRRFRLSRGRERAIAAAALAVIVVYWCGLGLMHRTAYSRAQEVADRVATGLNERVLRIAAMPTLANPLQWQCVAETDKAIYRYWVSLPASASGDQESVVDGYRTGGAGAIGRYEKPTGHEQELATRASSDRRARILTDFARFPLAHVSDQDCISQTIVQFADLRYTEPGASRGTFSVNVPIECASK
jgi:inner membrane protein